MQFCSNFLLILAVLVSVLPMGFSEQQNNTTPALDPSYFNTFVKKGLENYRDFKAENTITFGEEVPIYISNPEYTIYGNVGYFNYSGIKSLVADYAYSDPNRGFISLTCEWLNGTYSGSFNLAGVTNGVEGPQVFGGNGTWSIGTRYTSDFHGEITFQNVDDFAVFLENRTYFSLEDNFAYSPQVSFVGLFPNSSNLTSTQAQVINATVTYLRNYYHEKIRNVVKNDVITYLQEQFNEMPLSDIHAGVTLPPRTTPNPGCFYSLQEALEVEGYSLTKLETNEVPISSRVVKETEQEIVMEIITRKTVVVRR